MAQPLAALTEQHLNAIKRKSGKGAQVSQKERILRLMAQGGDAPGRLDAAGQAAWLCGYSQQRVHDIDSVRARKATKSQSSPDPWAISTTRATTDQGDQMSKHSDPTVKHDALLLFDAIDSNPNGDPDNAGKPRIDYDTGHGIVSDVSLKRKIRDSVHFRVTEELIPAERNLIFIRRGVSLNEQLEAAYTALGQTVPKKAKEALRSMSRPRRHT